MAPSQFTPLLMVGVFFVIFYFLLFRPQQKRAKEHQNLLSKLATGDEVVTTGGLLGKVTEVGETFVTLEIADGVRIKVQKVAGHAAHAQGHAQERLKMLEYPRWKYVLVAAVLLLALVFALPNFFGEDPALQVARKDHNAVTGDSEKELEAFLRERNIRFGRSYIDNGRLMVRFADVPQQLAARDAVNDKYTGTYITALSFAPRTPEFLRTLGLRPMPLGLDLRGGLYLLYQVDVNAAVAQALEGYAQDARRALATASIPVTDVTTVAVGSERPNAVRIVLPPAADASAARNALTQVLTGLSISTLNLERGAAILGVLTPAQIRERQDYAIQQNITTLRNRVNELGVSEPIVQRQGIDRINVQLPGVQNSAEVKDILGRVATLEFRLEDMQNNAMEAAQSRARAAGLEALHAHARRAAAAVEA